MAYNTMEQLKNRSNMLRAAKEALTMRNFADMSRYNRVLAERFKGISAKNSSPVYTAKSKMTETNDGRENYGVRAAMNNMGLDNSKIGWQDGYVTYNNMKFKPSYVKDGTSYAPKNDIQSFVNSIYKTEGKTPVRITDYASPAGMGGISYSDNGMVSVGGKNIPVLYMDGDRAVVDSNDLDKAYSAVKGKAGIDTAEEMYKKWSRQYKNALEKAYQGIADYGEWNYNPAQDPAYRAYSNMYRREGERAYRDAAAKLASRNNGNMTSAAQSLANQQLNYYMSMLADRIPELQKNAYERYKNGFDMKKQSYDVLRNEADMAWKQRTELNDTAKTDYAKWLENERQRTLNAQNDIMSELKAEGQKNANETEKIRQAGESAKNIQNEYDNAWNNAERRGFFTDSEGGIWNISKKENGEYLTPNEIKIRNDMQYFNEAAAPQMDYKLRLELEAKLKELEEKRKSELQKAQNDFEFDKLLAAYKASLK
jgi:hypothetical protein